MSFSDEEIDYLRSQPLARLATVNADGQPDVVPVAFEFDGKHFWVGGVGPDVAGTAEPAGDRWYGARRTEHKP